MAREFNNNNANYLDAGDATEIDITGFPITVSCWALADDVGSERTPVGKWPGQYIVDVFTGKLTVGCGAAVYVGTTPISTGVWHHLCLAQDGSLLKGFLDGNEDASGAAGTIVNQATPLVFGNNGPAAGTPWDGLLAEVAIWDVRLLNSEITALAAQADPRSIQAGNLQGYWPLCGDQLPEPDLINGNDAAQVGSVTSAAHPFGGGCVDPGIQVLVPTRISGRGRW